MTFGTFGTGEVEFKRPVELAIDSSDNLYVADTDNNRVQVLNVNGTFITQFGNEGPIQERLQNPIGIDVNSHGDVYVSDGRDTDIHVFSPSG